MLFAIAEKRRLEIWGSGFVGGVILKFIEFGIGNKWVIRTETELNDGTEVEEKGIARPIKFQSLYLRFWVGRTVVILDSKEGFKKMKKNRNAVKVIVGIKSL